MPQPGRSQTEPDRAQPLLREAMALRAAGDLPGAVALLRESAERGDPEPATLHLKMLCELQDHATLQQRAREAVLLLATGATAPHDTEHVLTVLYAAERASLPSDLLRPALDRIAADKAVPSELQQGLRAAHLRANFRDNLPARLTGGASIISLGLNCLPWHLPGRWGLRQPRDYIDLFVPFSLAGHTLEGTIGALEDDFATHCTPETVRPVTSQRGHEFALRRDRAAFWNHNRGAYWVKDDMAALQANNAAKAMNFRAAARRHDAVFLLGTCPTEYPEEPLDFLPRLDAALARFTGRRDNAIVITNQTARRAATALRRIGKRACFFYCPYPSKDYLWHVDAQADSPAGLAFERTYVNLLLRVLIGWGLFERRPDAPAPAGRQPDAA